MGSGHWTYRMVLLAVLVFPLAGIAAEKGHEGMAGMKM